MSRIETIGDCTVAFVGDDALVTIYAISPESDAAHPVYIGSTVQRVRHRIRAHVLDANKGSQLPLHAWIRANPRFTVTVLEVVSEDQRHARERHHVAQFPGLLNLTDGGPGLSGHRFAGSDHARRIAAKIRTGVSRICETCGAPFYRKLSQAAKGNDRFCSRSCSNTRAGR